MIPLVATGGLVVAVVLILLRMFAGPTLHDRLLAALSVLIKASLVCAALGAMLGVAALVDVALALAFAGLLTAAASLKLFSARTFQPPIGGSARG